MARTADKTDIPRRLTAAGHELFTRCGYHATGIQQITDQAGVPKGSFYNHFESKEAFAAAIIQHYAQWVDESWERCLSDAPPGAHEAVRHVFTRFIAHHEQQGCQGCLVGNFAAEMALAEFPNIRQTDSLPGKWLREESLRATEDLLTRNGNLVGIVTQNDDEAQGALTALRNAGLQPGNGIHHD